MSDKKQPLIKLNPIPDETMNALFLPAATSVGTATGDILDGLFNWALLPLRKYNIVKEKDLEDFAQKTNEALDKIPEKNRDQSKMGIALKALEDSRFQLNQEDMRQYFANLIANSLDDRINENIPPKFSEILANMTVQEAKLLTTIASYRSGLGLVPSIDIIVRNKETLTSNPKLINVLIVNYKALHHQFELSLLQSSNLVELNRDSQLSADFFKKQYKHFEDTVLADIEKNNEYDIDLSTEEYIAKRQFYSLTEMGSSFCKFVL